jgi:hypothetical protein
MPSKNEKDAGPDPLSWKWLPTTLCMCAGEAT